MMTPTNTTRILYNFLEYLSPCRFSCTVSTTHTSTQMSSFNGAQNVKMSEGLVALTANMLSNLSFVSIQSALMHRITAAAYYRHQLEQPLHVLDLYHLFMANDKNALSRSWFYTKKEHEHLVLHYKNLMSCIDLDKLVRLVCRDPEAHDSLIFAHDCMKDAWLPSLDPVKADFFDPVDREHFHETHHRVRGTNVIVVFQSPSPHPKDEQFVRMDSMGVAHLDLSVSRLRVGDTVNCPSLVMGDTNTAVHPLKPCCNQRRSGGRAMLNPPINYQRMLVSPSNDADDRAFTVTQQFWPSPTSLAAIHILAHLASASKRRRMSFPRVLDGGEYDEWTNNLLHSAGVTKVRPPARKYVSTQEEKEEFPRAEARYGA
jgi:hypothetical protein